MTWSLTTLRKELKDHLEAGGLKASSYWPDRFTTPLTIIDGGEPYLDFIEDQSFTDIGQEFHAKATVRFEVTMIAGVGDSEAMRDNLDDLICSVQNLLYTSDTSWTVEPTQQPFVIGPVQNVLYLASRLIVTTEITLEEV